MISKIVNVFLGFILAGLVITLFLPGIYRVRVAAARTVTINNLKAMALALHSCNDINRCLPPAFDYFAQSKLPTSVHVHLLPYVEQVHLYKKFMAQGKVTEDAVVETFNSQLDPSLSDPKGIQNFAANLRVFSDKGVNTDAIEDMPPLAAIEPGTASIPKTFKDGTSNTIVFSTKFAVCGQGGSCYGANPISPFAAFFGQNVGKNNAHPSDPRAIFQVAPEGAECLTSPLMAQSFAPEGIEAALADASVRCVAVKISPIIWNFALQPNDGYPLP